MSWQDAWWRECPQGLAAALGRGQHCPGDGNGSLDDAHGRGENTRVKKIKCQTGITYFKVSLSPNVSDSKYSSLHESEKKPVILKSTSK